MTLTYHERLAARTLRCGASRLWFDPTRANDIQDAITAADIRRLVKEGAIAKLEKQGTSRSRARRIAAQKRKGRRKNRGSRKGHARGVRKKHWMRTIRSIRSLLKTLRHDGKIRSYIYNDLYKKSKGGYFRSTSHVMLYLERNNLIVEQKGDHTVQKKKRKED